MEYQINYPLSQNKRQTGAAYELKAEEYLISMGYLVLERNFCNRMGEIDLIVKKDGVIRFVEVKYRTTHDFGHPLEAVGIKKQNQIRRVAMYYLMKNKLSEWTPCQFDVIAFEGEKMIHIENAF